jgi:hypothetical protein
MRRKTSMKARRAPTIVNSEISFPSPATIDSKE